MNNKICRIKLITTYTLFFLFITTTNAFSQGGCYYTDPCERYCYCYGFVDVCLDNLPPGMRMSNF
jgi:hypothetical protein